MKGGGKAGRGFQAAEIVVSRRFHLITNSPENEQNIHDLMKADFHCAVYFSKKIRYLCMAGKYHALIKQDTSTL